MKDRERLAALQEADEAAAEYITAVDALHPLDRTGAIGETRREVVTGKLVLGRRINTLRQVLTQTERKV